MSIKRVGIASLALLVVSAFAAPRLEAVTVLTSTFCSASGNPPGESSTCPTGLGATLQIDTIDSTAGDLNDYTVTLTLDSKAIVSPFAYISDVQFTINGFNTGGSPNYGDYSGPPLLDASGVSGSGATAADPDGIWTAYFDTISGSVNSCTSSGGGQSTCASTGSPWTNTGDVDTWVFTINLDGTNLDGTGLQITGSTTTNLRATFLKPNGRVAGILSPGGSTIGGNGGSGGSGGTGGGPGGVPDTGVPEPGTLMLLGTGFVVLAGQARRRLRKANV